MKIYDFVELICEKPEYTKEGVKKGDYGTIILDESIGGTWDVIFSEFYTGKDIAEVVVAEEDLRICEGRPIERFPPKPRELIESGRFRLSFECKLEVLDIVELIREKPAYTKAGVKKGFWGIVDSESRSERRLIVHFIEFYTGKHIVSIPVAEEDLQAYEVVPPAKLPPKPRDLVESGWFRLSPECRIESLDIVELIREKPEYAKAGVKKGDFGLVDGLYDGALQVTFSEFCTGKFIAKIPVAEEDLQVYDVVPPEKYPPKSE